MKKLMIALTLALSALSAHAEEIQALEDSRVWPEYVDGVQKIPQTGDLGGNVVSVYGGSAWGLERYLVTVGNLAAECEGDDCMASKTFELSGNFKNAATAVYSRKIDQNTYSIAVMTTVLEHDGNDNAKYYKAKILLRVKFTKDGVVDVADMSVVKL